MRGAAVALALVAACGGKKHGSPEDHRTACDAARRAASSVHIAFGTSWALNAQDRSPAGLCAAIANEANGLADGPATLSRMGDDPVLDKAVHMLAETLKAALDTTECMRNPAALADKLVDRASAFDESLDDTCPPAVQGAGTPK